MGTSDITLEWTPQRTIIPSKGNSISPRVFGGFDTNSSSDITSIFEVIEIFVCHKNFEKYSLRVNMKNILGEYSLFFKSNAWNYLHLN